MQHPSAADARRAAQPASAPRQAVFGWTGREQRALALAVLLSLAGLAGQRLWRRQADWAPVDSYRPAPALLVDVNRASWQELTMLPRIGPALADRILQWRQQHGPLSSVEQLRGVRGIGPKTVEQLRRHVFFPPQPLASGPPHEF